MPKKSIIIRMRLGLGPNTISSRLNSLIDVQNEMRLTIKIEKIGIMKSTPDMASPEKIRITKVIGDILDDKDRVEIYASAGMIKNPTIIM
jgi:DNA gyrase inhibitor GyrI